MVRHPDKAKLFGYRPNRKLPQADLGQLYPIDTGPPDVDHQALSDAAKLGNVVRQVVKETSVFLWVGHVSLARVIRQDIGHYHAVPSLRVIQNCCDIGAPSCIIGMHRKSSIASPWYDDTQKSVRFKNVLVPASSWLTAMREATARFRTKFGCDTASGRVRQIDDRFTEPLTTTDGQDNERRTSRTTKQTPSFETRFTRDGDKRFAGAA